jgi:opacity protein-like surface antigen
MRLHPIAVMTTFALLLAAPAFADATLFAGSTFTPSSRTTAGAAIGVSLVIVGFEFEYSNTSEASADGAPSLRTGMANVFVQTPVAIARFQPYVTAGGGGYRERLGSATETNLGTNAGGGVKITLAGPIRARIDYRVVKLAGDPLYSRVQRVYLGLNLRF